MIITRYGKKGGTYRLDNLPILGHFLDIENYQFSLTCVIMKIYKVTLNMWSQQGYVFFSVTSYNHFHKLEFGGTGVNFAELLDFD